MNARLFTLIALAAAAVAAAAPDKKIGRDIDTNHNGEIAVIVRFASVPSAASDQAVQKLGGIFVSHLENTNSTMYRIPASAARKIAALPEVKYISGNRQVRGTLNYSTAAVNAPRAWSYGFSGRNVGIAVIDSGISLSSDLANNKNKGRLVYQESFLHLNSAKAEKHPETVDQYGHGTHVAGIAAGDGTGSNTLYKGVAPAANLINLRVLDENGVGADGAVIAAIGRAIQLKDKYNIRVINLSLGRPVYESYQLDPLCQAVELAWKSGIVVVASAGNDGRLNAVGNQGYGTIHSPGNDPLVITVGAMKSMGTSTRSDDLIASYSSKGPTAIDHFMKPDLVAPGNQVVSTIGVGNHSLSRAYPLNDVKGGYFRLSGTSMAAPVVSGAAALLLEQNPAFTPDQVKARLMKTAGKSFPLSSIAIDPDTGVPYRSSYDAFTVGAGYLDINAALQSGDIATKQATSPKVMYDDQTRSVFLVRDDSAIWGTSVIWGASAVWGARIVQGGSVVWGASAVWGTSVVWGVGAVWGDNTAAGFSSIWGGSAVWGDSVVWGETSATNVERTMVLGEN